MFQAAKTADEVVRQVEDPQVAAGLPDELNDLNVLLMQRHLLQVCQHAIVVLRTLQSTHVYRPVGPALLHRAHLQSPKALTCRSRSRVMRTMAQERQIEHASHITTVRFPYT